MSKKNIVFSELTSKKHGVIMVCLSFLHVFFNFLLLYENGHCPFLESLSKNSKKHARHNIRVSSQEPNCFFYHLNGVDYFVKLMLFVDSNLGLVVVC
jgi:hypothetical protein